MIRPSERFRTAVEERCAELGWPATEVVVERPRDPEHGDWSTNVALALAGPLGKPPRTIAKTFLEGLQLDRSCFEMPTIAGPGFLNASLTPAYLQSVVPRILTDPDGYARGDRYAGKRINVEFVSSNPTGPLHVGHARNAALGDVMASLYSSQGAEVTREYYFNDVGRQMEVLAASVHARYQEQWDTDWPFPEEGYRGAYIRDLATEMTGEVGERFRGTPIAECQAAFRDFAADRLSDGIRRDLQRFGTRFDVWFNESTLYDDGRLDATLADLRSAGAVYDKDGAVWFNAEAFGDTEDRVLVKSTGYPTYLLPDITYHRDKHERGFDLAVDVWGADHHSYQDRVQAALRALGYPEGWLRIVIYQQVSLVEDGETVRLSTRANRMFTLAELMDDVGVDVTRYFLLARKGDTHMVFDLDLARRQSDENPVYYVQYAHARIAGVVQRLEDGAAALTAAVPEHILARLSSERELALLRALDEFPDVVAAAAEALEPHRVTDYLEGLARRFHVWYHDDRILVEDSELAHARLALARATRHVLREGLALLGISAPDNM